MQRSTRTDRRRGALAAVLASALVLAAACGTDDAGDADDAAGASTTRPAATTGDTRPTDGHDDPDAAHFAYEGELGPDRWGELSPENATCAAGTEQSPIDLTGAAPTDPGAAADLVVAYGEGTSTVVHNGHTVEVTHDGDSSIVLDGTTYDVVQFHLHHGSEHLVHGTPHAMELHIVHAARDGLAVVGVLVDVGEEHAALAPLFDGVPAEGDPPIEDVAIDLAEVLPDDRSAYRYDGSLTTPPCTEGVRWLVLDTPIQVSREQFDRFTEVVHPNARPVQPRNDRPLVHHDT